MFWSNAGFGGIAKIPELQGYETRYDPTVTPLNRSSSSKPSLSSYTTPDTSFSFTPPSEGQFYSIDHYHALYKSLKVTPTDVAKFLLPLIDRTSTPPGAHSTAWMQSREDLILKAAEASTLRFKEGKDLGVLDGVPVAIKDQIAVEGYKRFVGSTRDETVQGGGSSWCVLKWEEAGVVNLGTLNMHEFGLGMQTSISEPP
jgi:Asp-tRNA(Asn)/Glu-tRNA(Gln) amidotransferase A subunit family amidase